MPDLRVNGVRVAVEDVGDGPAILFLHGFPHDSSLWQHQMAGLNGFRRVAPDLRGLGRSDAPESGYSMATYAADLRSLMDRLVLDRVVLCGLSMGGYIAFECLRLFPERVAGLVLIDTRAEPDSDAGRVSRDALIAELRTGGTAVLPGALLSKQLSPTTVERQPDVVSQLRRMMLSAPLSGAIGALEAMKQRADSRPLLPSLGRIPVLVICGEDDVLTPPDAARAMVDAIPGAELELVTEAGHLTPLEKPELVTTRLHRFLDQRVSAAGMRA
jgi:pimeloyl-ACP methyl ester carboxylesterase